MHNIIFSDTLKKTIHETNFSELELTLHNAIQDKRQGPQQHYDVHELRSQMHDRQNRAMSFL